MLFIFQSSENFIFLVKLFHADDSSSDSNPCVQWYKFMHDVTGHTHTPIYSDIYGVYMYSRILLVGKPLVSLLFFMKMWATRE